MRKPIRNSNFILSKKRRSPIRKKRTKVSHDKWPGYIPPQLAILVEAPPEGENWVHEIKYDGYRLQLQIKNSRTTIFTRGGKDWTELFPTLTKAMGELKVDSAIFDGEVVVVDNKGVSHLDALKKALSTRNYSNMRIYLFDLLYLNGKDLRKHSLKQRKELLKSILSKSNLPLFFSDDVNGNGNYFFKLCCQLKLEGVVSKDSTAPYRSGRSRSWFKSKCHLRQEFVIGGFTKGKGDREEVGALLLGVYEKIHGQKKLRYVGKVGTGFDSDELVELKEKVFKLQLKHTPFDINSPEGKNIYWIKPSLVAEIKFSEWSTHQILRHPVFVGLRNKRFKSEINEQIALSHPDKILFPEEKITKRMIAHYYEMVEDLILPYVTDRPLSIVRCPDGAEKKCFYQKHLEISKISKYFNRFKVIEKSQENWYISLNSAQGLRQLVQMNAFEIHTWNSHYQTIMHPDQIVLDFDPAPDVSFKALVQGCLEMKTILDKLKLKSFIKVTGGKGLHIHIPIEPIYSWDQVRAFSRALAFELVSRRPKEFIATMSKKNRKGKIFIDYFRNIYGATSVAPYALRAKNKSAVALPIDWSELSKIKSSDQFTLKKALLKIKKRKSDPWKNFFRIKQKITILE